MKKILNKLFGRLFLTGIVILIQFIWIVATLYEAEGMNPWFAVVLRCISVVIALYVVYKDMRPHNKLSWIFLILFIAYRGAMLALPKIKTPVWVLKTTTVLLTFELLKRKA